MRSLALALALAAVPLPALAHDHDDDDPQDAPAVVDRGDIAEQLARVDAFVSDAIGRARGRPDAVRALRRARQQLDAVRDQVTGAPDPREWWRAQRRPNRWLDALAAEAQGRSLPPFPGPAPRVPPPPPVAVPAPPPPPQLMPISDASLAQLLAAIDQQPSSAGRLGVLQPAAAANWFLVRQVQVLLGRFAFPPDQVQAARLLQPRLLDRENEHHLAAWLQAPPGGPYAGLVERQSFEARAGVRLQPGVYRGTFKVAGSSLTVEGAGRDQTIIDGNLVIGGAFNNVRGLTVLGKVVFDGSQNRLQDVDYRAGIEDRGLLNKY